MSQTRSLDEISQQVISMLDGLTKNPHNDLKLYLGRLLHQTHNMKQTAESSEYHVKTLNLIFNRLQANYDAAMRGRDVPLNNKVMEGLFATLKRNPDIVVTKAPEIQPASTPSPNESVKVSSSIMRARNDLMSHVSVIESEWKKTNAQIGPNSNNQVKAQVSKIGQMIEATKKMIGNFTGKAKEKDEILSGIKDTHNEYSKLKSMQQSVLKLWSHKPKEPPKRAVEHSLLGGHRPKK